MTKIEITRTELVWPGKYDEDGNLVPSRRVNLPFQVIKRVNETRATREQRKQNSQFDIRSTPAHNNSGKACPQALLELFAPIELGIEPRKESRPMTEHRVLINTPHHTRGTRTAFPGRVRGHSQWGIGGS